MHSGEMKNNKKCTEQGKQNVIVEVTNEQQPEAYLAVHVRKAMTTDA